MKAAVYCGTRNLYQNMVTAAKSLAAHSSVDMIYFLTDGPDFPYELPEYVKCIDVSKQSYFPPNCPNIYKLWSYMALMRAVLADLFPDLDRILSLDVDTIVDKNIDELWDLNLSKYYFAAVKEPVKSASGKLYVNVGVAMFNLDTIRENKMQNKFVRALNNRKYRWAEQDCMNELCYGHILEIPSIYNANNYTQPCSYNMKIDNDHRDLCENPKIIHFANEPKQYNRALTRTYQDISWEQIRRPKCDT